MPAALPPLTISVTDAARLLGIGRLTAYRAIREGALPGLRFGDRIVVPLPKLAEILGVPLDQLSHG